MLSKIYSSAVFPRLKNKSIGVGVALLPLVLVLAGAVAAPPKKAAPKPKAVAAKGAGKAIASSYSYAKDVKPVLDKYCAPCHSGDMPQADLAVDKYKNEASLLADRKKWDSIHENVSAGHMPPPGMPAIPAKQKEAFIAYIETVTSNADCKVNDPGRVTMRRLNRAEYNNSVRDLFGVDLRPGDAFPSDDVGYGFDNIGDVLSLSPLLMEKYLAAAEGVAKNVIVAPESGGRNARYNGVKLAGAGGLFDETDGRMLYSDGETFASHNFIAAGEYVIKVQAWGQQAGPDKCRMAIRLDGKDVKILDVPQAMNNPGTFEVRVQAFDGKQKVGAAFLNDYFDDTNTKRSLRGDRNLVVNYIEVQGPFGAVAVDPKNLPASHKKLIPVHPSNTLTWEAAAKKNIAGFLPRVWRRPATAAEVDRLVKISKMAEAKGESFERGMQLAVTASLVSPNFLFRVERNAAANDPKAKSLVSSYEMASRLSYFLWSSMPDEELLALAAKDKLQDPKVLRAQVARMLKDDKAQGLSDNFAMQWLTLRNLAIVNPDATAFPMWNEELRDAMRQETLLYFEGVVRENRPVTEFLDSNYTYLNETLAKHYGNTEVTGKNWRKVTLRGPNRGGLVTQAAVLTVTSNPTRTSPVKRGKWVLDNILGTPPPPAPPNIPELDKGEITGKTLRERLEKHRADPSCASCHRRMDPIGFGLENFDAVGRWRAEDGKEGKINASGVLPDGAKFTGPAQLKKVLMSKKDQFNHSLSERLLTYATGRGVLSTDRCHVDTIAESTKASGYKFGEMVTQIVLSDPFRKRRGDEGMPKEDAKPKVNVVAKKP